MQHFTQWAEWFENYEHRQLQPDWAGASPTDPDDLRIVAPSIRQFQLGESSEARHLLRKVRAHAERHGDISYLRAMQAFIAEENRHSDLLGRYMDSERLPRARRHWTDSLFRGIRHALPLQSSITVLLSAELIAVPYYTALRDATDSVILKTICKQILRDELMHIRFQSRALRYMRVRRSGWQRRRDALWARMCLHAAAEVVWFSHNEVLRKGGFDYLRYKAVCREYFRWSRAMVRGDAPIANPLEAHLQAVAPPDEISLLSGRPLNRLLFQKLHL